MKKKLLSILLVLCMAATLLPGTALAAEFNDVDGHWGQEAIERWAGYGVLNGKGDGVFDPNGVMTRAEFATMLVNMMGYTKTSTDTFSDLNPGAWYADAMSKLVAAGVMNGVGGGRIDPMGQITREQAAVMLCRAFGIKASSTGTIAFQDSGKVSSWARDAMTALSERGMINGVGNNILSPDGIVNRATAAKLTSNMVAEYVTTDKVLSGEITGVVIVAKGAKVEIKDATVTAPIVVESASVSLTNTKAEEVKVAGEKAAVTADKDSTVTDVSIGGEAPAVELNGKVEGTVTVEEGATAPEIKGDGVKADQVVNNTDADVTVNGETVKPEDKPETPSTSDSGSGSGSGSGSHGNGTTETEQKPDVEDADKEASHTHVWVKDTDSDAHVAPTCTTDGSEVQKCTGEEGECPATNRTQTVKIPATGHVWNTTAEADGSFKCTKCDATKAANHTCKTEAELTDSDWSVVQAASCSTKGSAVAKCDCGAVIATKELPMAAHTEVAIADVEPTCTTSGLEGGKKCSVCGKVTVEQTKVDALDHVYGDFEAEENADCTSANGITLVATCTLNNEDCTAKKTKTIAKKTKHIYDSETGECKNEGCTVTCEHEKAVKAAVDGDCKKGFTKTCPTCKNVATIEGNQDHTYGDNGQCTAEGCRQTRPEEKPEHTHVWQDASETNKEGWVSDNKGNHTRVCTVTDPACDATEADLKGVCDTSGEGNACSKCGYKAQPAQHEHKWQGATDENPNGWVSNGNGEHTRTCTVTDPACNAKETDLKGTCTDGNNDNKCDVCGGDVTPSVTACSGTACTCTDIATCDSCGDCTDDDCTCESKTNS